MSLLHLITTPNQDPEAQEDLRQILKLSREISQDPQGAAQKDLRQILQLIRKISGADPDPSPDPGGDLDPGQHDKFLVEK